MNENKTPIMIDENLCDGCGRCAFICSMGVIDFCNRPGIEKQKIAFVKNPQYCMYCEACVIDCKRGAIRLNPQYGSMNIEKISDVILKKKKRNFKFWKK